MFQIAKQYGQVCECHRYSSPVHISFKEKYEYKGQQADAYAYYRYNDRSLDVLEVSCLFHSYLPFVFYMLFSFVLRGRSPYCVYIIAYLFYIVPLLIFLYITFL